MGTSKNYGLLIVITFMLISNLSISQNHVGYKNFPSDSAKWYIRTASPDHAGCLIRYIRYSSSGDTTLGGKKYHKIYRQTVRDSTAFTLANDTLRMLIRLNSDSHRVIMRFVDSVNQYGTSEHTIADFDLYVWGVSTPFLDTFYRPITANQVKLNQATIFTEPQWLFGPQNCTIEDDSGNTINLNINSYAVKLTTKPQNSCLKERFGYLGYIGESEKSWFSTDLDSAAIYNTQCTCRFNYIASLYQVEMRLLRGNPRQYKWYRVDQSCLKTIGLKPIKPIHITNKISPNPFSDQFQIEYSKPIKSLKILDISGKVMLDRYFPETEMKQSVSSSFLKPGVYMLIINEETSRRLIKLEE